MKVENLTGHKLPTAYPSRRAWLHVVVQDRNGKGCVRVRRPEWDGSIVGNDNDADPHRYEPHYRKITNATAGRDLRADPGRHAWQRNDRAALTAVGYLKDNRLLPSGFDKRTAERDIAVVGDALDDPGFTDKGSVIRYVVDTGGAAGPFHARAGLWYQPIGFRWAHNLAQYNAAEPQRFVRYYESEAQRSAVELASADASY